MAIPVFAEDANLDDPREHLAWLFGQWPKVEESQPYPPAPRPMLPFHSEWAYRMGLRFHPELAEIVKVPGPDGFPVFVSREEADTLRAQAAEVDVEAEVNSMLQQVDPALAASLQNLSEEERQIKLQEQREELARTVETLTKIQEALGGVDGGNS